MSNTETDIKSLILFLRPPGLHKALSGVQEGGSHWRSPNGKRPLPAPSHAEVKLLWKSADECCWLGTCLLQYHLVLTASYCDIKTEKQTDQVASHLQSFGLIREGTASNRMSRTLVGWSHPACAGLLLVYQGLSNGGTVKGCFQKDPLRSDKSTETDNVPWRKCDWTVCSDVADGTSLKGLKGDLAAQRFNLITWSCQGANELAARS